MINIFSEINVSNNRDISSLAMEALTRGSAGKTLFTLNIWLLLNIFDLRGITVRNRNFEICLDATELTSLLH